MYKYAHIKNKKVVGIQYSSKAINHADLILLENKIASIGDNYLNGVFSGKSLNEVQAEKITQIKAEANERIKSIDWMNSRAERHTALSKPTKKAKNDVYQLQQDIEDASDLAEIAVNALTTIKAVNDFTW